MNGRFFFRNLLHSFMATRISHAFRCSSSLKKGDFLYNLRKVFWKQSSASQGLLRRIRHTEPTVSLYLRTTCSKDSPTNFESPIFIPLSHITPCECTVWFQHFFILSNFFQKEKPQVFFLWLISIKCIQILQNYLSL